VATHVYLIYLTESGDYLPWPNFGTSAPGWAYGTQNPSFISGNLTFEQARVLKGLMEGMQKEVAAGVVRRDPNSLGADGVLNRAPCCVK